jgi:hypothetical protein
LFGSLISSLGSHGRHSNRFPILVDGKYGYIDRTGRVVIRPQFDSAGNFSDGLALVITEGSYHYIDSRGGSAFAAEYENARDFSDGMASVYVSGPLGRAWGAINVKGQLAVPPLSSFPLEFHQGLAWCWNSGGPPFSFVDRVGDMVIRAGVRERARFSEGLARASDGGRHGYINKAGKVIVKGQFDWSGDFHEGLAFFMNEGNPPDRWGYINKVGKVVIKPQFEKAGDFSEGLAPVRIDGKWGYINRAGKVVIAPQFDEARSFSEGLAVVSGIGGSPLFGYIDRRGKTVIKPQFGRAGDFSDGLAQVWIGDRPRPREMPRWREERWPPLERSSESGYVNSYRSGYIDKTGKYVW